MCDLPSAQWRAGDAECCTRCVHAPHTHAGGLFSSRRGGPMPGHAVVIAALSAAASAEEVVLTPLISIARGVPPASVAAAVRAAVVSAQVRPRAAAARAEWCFRARATPAAGVCALWAALARVARATGLRLRERLQSLSRLRRARRQAAHAGRLGPTAPGLTPAAWWAAARPLAPGSPGCAP